MDIYNKHYIKVRGLMIVGGFSDAFKQPEVDDICINKQGGYQFRLFPNGDENPILVNKDGAHIYRWENGAVREATNEEKATEIAEKPTVSPPPPDPRDLAIAQLMRDVAAIKGGDVNV